MTAYVLLTAMPPTTGHLQLIQFAESLAGDEDVVVLLNTQPGEPFTQERAEALRAALARTGRTNGEWEFVHHHRYMPQDPANPGFQDLWSGIMWGLGAKEGDLLVTSELYGKWLAKATGMVWMPYDVAREINPAKATVIRENPKAHWDQILPEFRKHLQTRVTIFGAESCGKTTLARELAEWNAAYFLPEYARPYLEQTVNEITDRSMKAIWHGQAALQRQQLLDSSLVIQDTDLFSTLGYWRYWIQVVDFIKTGFGPRLPFFDTRKVQEEATELQSDLYIMLPSNIDFEPDPLRYGGDEREIDDDWWTTLLIQEHLPFHVLSCDPKDRFTEALKLVNAQMQEKLNGIAYDRHGH